MNAPRTSPLHFSVDCILMLDLVLITAIADETLLRITYVKMTASRVSVHFGTLRPSPAVCAVAYVLRLKHDVM